MQVKPAKSSARWTFWRITGVVALLLVLTGAFVVHRLRQRIPPELMLDIRAGIAARKIADPDARFENISKAATGPSPIRSTAKKPSWIFLTWNTLGPCSSS